MTISKGKRPRQGATDPTGPQMSDSAIRAAKALRMRIDGATFQQIAEQVPYCDRATAYRVVMRELRRSVREPADELRELELARLDKIVLALTPKMLKGDTRAAEQIIRTMEQRARYINVYDASSNAGEQFLTGLQKLLTVADSPEPATAQPDTPTADTEPAVTP